MALCKNAAVLVASVELQGVRGREDAVCPELLLGVVQGSDRGSQPPLRLVHFGQPCQGFVSFICFLWAFCGS